MREILFRGKRVDNGEWVEGFYAHYDDGNNRHAYIILCGPEENRYFPFIEVDPSTVGQFTGLTDKNGKKIFEGDILETRMLHGKPIYGVMSWNTNSRGFGAWAVFSPLDEFEVAGNIHDNPKLVTA
jgi:uncharacterized phage protein (TIGR01671 family)